LLVVPEFDELVEHEDLVHLGGHEDLVDDLEEQEEHADLEDELEEHEDLVHFE
jgi:hypothetical protein